MAADEWLDKASGKWLTGPEVDEHGGLSGRVLRLGTEKMNDGNERPVIYLSIAGRERILAINVGASEKLRAALRGKSSAELIGKTIVLTTEIAKNPRLGTVGPAVRIKEVKK